jgi:hypothetical protein
MDPAITAALIAAGAGIVGASVSAFAPELRLLIAGKVRANADLCAKWHCSWSGTPDAGADERIEDIVTIAKVRGEEFWGEATNTQYGGYKIKGRVSRSNLVTLHYEGLQLRQPLGGVVILKLSATRDVMRGHWYEYGREEEIVGGSTEWRKMSQ